MGTTAQRTPESGGRAGYDGYKKKNGSKTHVAVDTLGHLLALHVTPANEQERDQVGVLAEAVQEVTGENVQLAWSDQGYTGKQAAQAARRKGHRTGGRQAGRGQERLCTLAQKVGGRAHFGWIARCRRLARDYERLPHTFAGLHWIMFAGPLLARLNCQSFVSS